MARGALTLKKDMDVNRRRSRKRVQLGGAPPEKPVLSQSTCSFTNTSVTWPWKAGGVTYTWSVSGTTAVPTFTAGTSILPNRLAWISGLTQGSIPVITVTATANGQSVASDPFTASTTPAMVPVTVTGITSSSITMSWTGIAGVSYTPIAGLHTSVNLAATGGTITGVGTLTHTVTGLTPDSYNYVAVNAQNVCGVSGTSPSNFTLAANVPRPTVANPYANTLRLPPNPPVVTISSVTQTQTSCSLRFVVSVGMSGWPASVASYTFNGGASIPYTTGTFITLALIPGENNTFVASGTNAGGTTTATRSFPTAPLTPTALSVVANSVSGTGFTLSWAAENGSATTYNFFIGGSAVTPSSRGTNSATFTGLTANSSYSVTFSATANGTTSGLSTALSVSTGPAAPVISGFSSITDSGFTVNWTGAAGATSYSYLVNRVSATPVSSTTRSARFTGYSAGEHSVSVIAVNSAGRTPSAESSLRVVSTAEIQASSSVQQTASSAEEQVASSAQQQAASSAQQQAASSAQQQAASSAQQQSASSAQQQAASSALEQRASSAQQQADSSAQQQAASSAQQQADSSAQQQAASSSLPERESSARQQAASSALQQSASSALHQRSSSALQQLASSAQQQNASSAEQQSASSAVEQRASSALQQTASSAQQQNASSAQQQSASSAVEQRASSAQQQTASSAQQQSASSAQQQAASASLSQRQSSAQEQTTSSAQQQTASSAQQQSASSAQQQAASASLSQRQSSAQQQTTSSAQQQTASSAQQQSASSAQQQAASASLSQRESSAQQQTTSSAQQQTASSAQQQSASSAQQQAASASLSQRQSSAQEQQTASSAQQQLTLRTALTTKDEIKITLEQLQAEIIANIDAVYRPGSSRASGSTLTTLQSKLLTLEQMKRSLLTSATSIFQVSPTYQDSRLQMILQNTVAVPQGQKRVFDTLRNTYIYLDANSQIVAAPPIPYFASTVSGAR